VWGLNGASLEAFRWARRQGIKCVLEQVIAPASQEIELLAPERDRWHEWLLEHVQADRSLLGAREEQEWLLADRIISCSEFVSEGLRRCGVPAEKCRLVRFGVDLTDFPVVPPPEDWPPDRRLRVLFVGEVGLRKGAPYLLQALAALGPERVDGRLRGNVGSTLEAADSPTSRESFDRSRAQTSVHSWAWADLLVLPSLCEDRPGVVRGAASGLPVVATANAGTPMVDGVDGTPSPSGIVQALAEALKRYHAQPGH
jgi:glycosyltransferase involved in cell wall biosynthesis